MRTDLIYSRKNDNSPLTLAQIASRAPAALADGHDESLSGIYGEVDTKKAIEIMADYGYHVTQAAQKKPRKYADMPYAEHLLAFAKPNTMLDGFADGLRPEIVMYNSRNGLSSLKLFTGAYRFICSNGIIAGDGEVQKIRHTYQRVSEVEDAIRHAAESLPGMVETIHRYRSIKLADRDVLEFAKNAVTSRWEWLEQMTGEERGSFSTNVTAQQVGFGINRREDASDDLWTVYNRVQENIIRGGANILSVTDKKPGGSLRNTSPVRSVKANVQINQALWHTAQQFAGEEVEVAA